MSNYGYTKKVPMEFDEAIKKVKASLMEQGFGVLTEIDVKATMKQKLDKDIDDYVILGACNPSLAAQAIDAEIEIGLLLPCNVIIYKKNGDVFVSAMMPSVAMSFVKNDALADVAKVAEAKLSTSINNLL